MLRLSCAIEQCLRSASPLRWYVLWFFRRELSFFGIIQVYIFYKPSGRGTEGGGGAMKYHLQRSDIITSSNISPNPPRSEFTNDTYITYNSSFGRGFFIHVSLTCDIVSVTFVSMNVLRLGTTWKHTKWWFKQISYIELVQSNLCARVVTEEWYKTNETETWYFTRLLDHKHQDKNRIRLVDKPYTQCFMKDKQCYVGV